MTPINGPDLSWVSYVWCFGVTAVSILAAFTIYTGEAGQ